MFVSIIIGFLVGFSQIFLLLKTVESIPSQIVPLLTSLLLQNKKNTYSREDIEQFLMANIEEYQYAFELIVSVIAGCIGSFLCYSMLYSAYVGTVLRRRQEQRLQNIYSQLEQVREGRRENEAYNNNNVVEGSVATIATKVYHLIVFAWGSCMLYFGSSFSVFGIISLCTISMVHTMFLSH